MTLWELRLRAWLWTALAAIAIGLPWTRGLLAPGRADRIILTSFVTATAGALTIAALRRRGGAGAPVAVRRVRTFIVIGAFGEELLFRGVLLSSLASTAGAGGGIFATSALFGVAHWRRGKQRDVFVHAVTGLVLGGVALLTAGWLSSAVMHAAYNCTLVEWRAAPTSGEELTVGGLASITNEGTVSAVRAENWS